MSYHLVQRCKAQGWKDPSYGFDGFFSLDYMGSAEFEFGAIPKSLKRMRAAKDPGRYRHPHPRRRSQHVAMTPFHYFVSYQWAAAPTRWRERCSLTRPNGFGSCQINRSHPVATMDDMDLIRDDIVNLLKSEGAKDPEVAVLSYQLLAVDEVAADRGPSATDGPDFHEDRRGWERCKAV